MLESWRGLEGSHTPHPRLPQVMRVLLCPVRCAVHVKVAVADLACACPGLSGGVLVAVFVSLKKGLYRRSSICFGLLCFECVSFLGTQRAVHVV